MPRSTTPTDVAPSASANPAISGSGSGMGAGGAAGPGPVGGVQSGTINAQGERTGAAPDPSLGSGMAVPGRGDRMGDAATGGAAVASSESFELPYRVIAAPPQRR